METIVDRPKPTYRQIDYWRRAGALAPHRPTGCGVPDPFTYHESRKLCAIAEVIEWFRLAGFQGVPVEIVARLWQRLDVEPIVRLEYGTITVTAIL